MNKKKNNSILINYDQRSKNLLSWYQKLVAESLGKHQKGLLPIVSNMPKDNHSVMQLYLDGFQNNLIAHRQYLNPGVTNMTYDHEPFEYKITDGGFKLRYPQKWLWSPRSRRLRYSELRFLEVSSVPVSKKANLSGNRKAK